MAVINSNKYPLTGRLAPSEAKLEPTPLNVEVAVANSEYSALLPAGTKAFALSFQDGVAENDFRVAFESGKVAGENRPYIKYNCDCEWYEDNLCLTNKRIYFACSAGSQWVQILVWR